MRSLVAWISALLALRRRAPGRRSPERLGAATRRVGDGGQFFELARQTLSVLLGGGQPVLSPIHRPSVVVTRVSTGATRVSRERATPKSSLVNLIFSATKAPELSPRPSTSTPAPQQSGDRIGSGATKRIAFFSTILVAPLMLTATSEPLMSRTTNLSISRLRMTPLIFCFCPAATRLVAVVSLCLCGGRQAQREGGQQDG